MQFSKIAGLIGVLASTTLAFPTAQPVDSPVSLNKRQDVGVFLCVDSDFTGYCVHIVQPANTCSMYTRPQASWPLHQAFRFGQLIIIFLLHS